MKPSIETWHQAEAALKGGRFADARVAYSALLEDPAWRVPARLRLSAVASAQGQVREAVAQALAGFAARDGSDQSHAGTPARVSAPAGTQACTRAIALTSRRTW